MKRLWMVLLAPAAGIVLAATPPSLINYQGLLRSAADEPLSGSYDMVFRFFDAQTGGNEILVDRHLTVSAQAVTVAGGLFSAALGGGEVLDGAGPGTYTSVAAVFRDHVDVWLSVQIGAEALVPRTRVFAAPYAHNATNLGGRPPSAFLDTSAAAQTKAGALTVSGNVPTAITGLGASEGGVFSNSTGSGIAHLGTQSIGIQAGGALGGYFSDDAFSSVVQLAGNGVGISSSGMEAGGCFNELDSSASTCLATDGYGGQFENSQALSAALLATPSTGVYAYGPAGGGFFFDIDDGGTASLGKGAVGVEATGSAAGGVFRATNASAEVWLASPSTGLKAWGHGAGGTFEDYQGTSRAFVANDNYGIRAWGVEFGGYFEDWNSSGHAYIGWGDYGIQGFGNQAGGFFRDLDTGAYAYVGSGVAKIYGSGDMSFAQNHPYDREKVVVYAAPEGDEVATYTRGNGRLVDGVARVALGPTFAWVTDPDIGLTAHLTPRGADPVALAVESLTTSEIVVRGPAGADTAFDFLVFGLRIGFEEVAIVQEKKDESWIPSMSEHRARYEKSPELRSFNALERFKDMAAKVDGKAEVDRSRGAALRAAIEEYDPAVHGPVSRPDAGELPAPQPGESERVEPAVAIERHVPREEPARDAIVARRDEVRMPVAEAVEEGDLLVLDLERPGLLRRATSAADPTVVGIAARAPAAIDGQLSVALVEVLGVVRADAGYGAIRPGDLLASSPTPGHVMRAADPLPGTVVGKALESLEVGTGQIRVLVLPR